MVKILMLMVLMCLVLFEGVFYGAMLLNQPSDFSVIMGVALLFFTGSVTIAIGTRAAKLAGTFIQGVDDEIEANDLNDGSDSSGTCK